MTQLNRLAGAALVAGGSLSIAGYLLSGTLVRGSDHARFTNPHFLPLYSIALAGASISTLGLPAILAAHGERARRLTLVGYVGTFAALAMLNVGEGVIEAFVKPYLVTHGGIPDNVPTGLALYFLVATLFTAVGLISLGVAVLRAKVFAWWVGALLIAAVPLSMVGQALPGPLVELADYCAFAALITIGWRVAKPTTQTMRGFSREREIPTTT
ncbi:MAG TPA: hypothetical protein VGQ38_18395 [Gaiellaceae bacterium]|nr:hypothetical protein [Gaiellaceae bacterium]